MPRITKPEFAEDLTRLFLPLEPRSLSPDELSATLQLTHPFLPGTHKLRNFTFSNTASAINVPNVFGPVVPDDRYWYVNAIDVRTNAELVARRLRCSLRIVLAAGVLDIVIIQRQLTLLVDDGVCINRPLIMPPRSLLFAEVDALTAGAKTVLNFAYIEHQLLEPHPTV
jgi:hypothetical protein